MTKTFPVLLASLIAVSTVAAPLQVLAQQGQSLDRIAAIVDEDVVLQSELDRAIINIKAQYAGREGQLPPDDVLSRQVLERLVLVKLQVTRAEGSGIKVSDQELNQALNAIAQQNGSNLDALRQRLAADGVDFNDFRSSVRDEITVQRLRQSFAQSRISVSEGEVDAALKQEATAGTQYHLAHILIALPEGATAEQIATGQTITEYHGRHILIRVNDQQDNATAKAKIDSIRARIAGGAEFEAEAKASSEDTNSKGQGGDLGWFPAEAFGPDFGKQVTGLSDGGVSQPFRTDAGWHIVQRVATRQTDSGTDNKRAQIRETIGRRKLEEEYNRYLQELRGEAYVDLRAPAAAPAAAPAPAPAPTKP